MESKTNKPAGEAAKATHSALTDVVTDADGNAVSLPAKTVTELIRELGEHPIVGLYYRAQATSGLWRWTNGETQEEEHREIEARYNIGRYTVWEAAQYLLDSGFKDTPKELVRKISEGITAGMLPAYAHAHDGTWTEYQLGAKVRAWYIECYWDDLNTWLGKTEPRSSIRFPEPSSSNNEPPHNDESRADESSAHTHPNRQAGAPEDEIRKNRQAALVNLPRGAKGLILECWDDIERLHGPNANASQVERFLNRTLDRADRKPSKKTIHNLLSDFRREKLIP